MIQIRKERKKEGNEGGRAQENLPNGTRPANKCRRNDRIRKSLFGNYYSNN